MSRSVQAFTVDAVTIKIVDLVDAILTGANTLIGSVTNLLRNTYPTQPRLATHVVYSQQLLTKLTLGDQYGLRLTFLMALSKRLFNRVK